MKQIRWLLPLLFSICVVGLRADSESHKTATLELLEVMDMEAAMLGTVDSLLELEVQNNPSIAPFRPIMRNFLTKHMTGPKMNAYMCELYMEVFTEEEINDLITFYRTPTGQRTLEVLPELMQRGGEWGQRQVMENMGELQRDIMAEAMRLEALMQEEAPAADPAAEPPVPEVN